MTFNLEKFIEEKKYSSEQKAYFEKLKIENVFYYRRLQEVSFKISVKKVLPFILYQDLLTYLSSLINCKVKLFFSCDDSSLNLSDANQYYRYFTKDNKDLMNNSVLVLNEQNNLALQFVDITKQESNLQQLPLAKQFFKDIGYKQEIEIITLPKENDKEIGKNVILKKPQRKETRSEQNKKATRNSYYKKNKTYTLVGISDLKEAINNVEIKAKIFKVEERSLKNGSLSQTLYLADKNDACIANILENKYFTKEILALNKEGRYASFFGDYQYNPFFNDYRFNPHHIEFFEKDESLHDEEEVKRIELHAHSNKSEMDGVCDASEIVEAAFSMGHKAVAITDHNVVQAFPICQRTVDKLLKQNPERDFKVLYGCEMNMSDPYLNPVYNSDERLLQDCEYIVFDLETTGLSARHDRVIEFGGVLLSRGNILESVDFFINPQRQLPTHIRNLTNISQTDVDEAKTFAENKERLLAFLKDRVLVAHNASFDFGFLNAELKRMGLPPLKNAVIDTLDISRLLFKKRRTYRLGNIARQYGVDYDEEVAHRANYDAECLAKVFNLMLKDIQAKKIKTLQQLTQYHGENDYIKKNPYHVSLLCKNKEGLKDLFKLVSIAHTDTLAVFGKANSKVAGAEFLAEPRLLRETLNKYRQNLLVGSGCQNGEVFAIASTKDEQALSKAISFYDYIEIQPLDNYRNLVIDRNSYSFADIKQFQKDIIDEALKQNKLIVASGDLHYVKEEEKILRDIYINTQGIGGVHHPLFVFNKEKRAQQITPDQHFFNTKEMLAAFKWLNDESLIRDLVINNPIKIADQCNFIKPIHDKLYTPSIEGSVEKLTKITYDKAYSIYGNPLPEIIAARLKKELDSIIGNGYAVIYYVSHLLVKKSNNDGYLVGSRGSVGSSLVATMSGITEVNPLPPHYICLNCHYLKWEEDYGSGYDLPDCFCPNCSHKLVGDGQNIPFETFLGFHGDKVPDIDLNFSGEYQPQAHLFTREIFGEDHVFRAGTIGTVADKTAFGYVSGYCEEKGIESYSFAQRKRLASGCEGVKRTTGQHPGGIIVIPSSNDVYDFTPIQYPANDPEATWKTTHFDFHEIHDNVLKFDILGHVDPTAMRQLQLISGIDPLSIPMNDPLTMSIFSSSEALNIQNPSYCEKTGACGLPEFGTRFVRGILEETKPRAFSDLIIISGLSHGTDVWNNNAKDLIDQGVVSLRSVIGCRDDIMLGLIRYGLPPKEAFDIMEKVRKGKGLSQEQEALMKGKKVPNWYIDSCKKIKYMFPKAHAVAYVIMAVRIAWFKVHHPEYFYVSFFSLRCDAYEIETMIKDADSIKKRMDEIQRKMNAKEKENQASKKERDLFDTLEICYEMVSRGYRLRNIDLNLSQARHFIVNPSNNHEIIPPFTILDGLGENVAESIVKARKEHSFISQEDLLKRTQITKTLCERMEKLGVLKGLDESDQLSLF